MGYIKNGKFIKGKTSISLPTDQYKTYRHEEQRIDHKADILQPRIGGRPNPDFIRNYPERAKDYFSENEYKEGINGN